MNTNNNENISIVLELSKQIDTLQTENYELRQEIARLRKLIPSNNETENQNTELLNYYISRYEEIHNYVLENRIKALNDDIEGAQKVYDVLMSREDLIESIAEKNASIKEQVAILKTKIEESRKTFEEDQQEFERMASNVTDQENNLYNSTLDYYNTLLSKLSIGNMSETIEYMNFLMDIMKFTLYDQVITYLSDAKKALEKLDELTFIQNNLNEQIRLQEEEIVSLEAGYEEISFEETERKLDSIAYEIANKKQVRTELQELFEELDAKNKKTIKDEINHYRILQLNNQQIALKLDEMILHYKESLATVDTDSNILLNKKIKLNQLNEKMQNIYPFKEKLDVANNEYEQLQSMHQSVSSNIDDIEDFIMKTKKIVNASLEFKHVIDEYNSIKLKMATLKQNKEAYILRERNLTEERKKILNNPYGKTDLLQIDDNLKELQDSIRIFSDEYATLESRLYHLKDTEQDNKLITIYERYLLCEKQLPLLYKKQENLSGLINDKFIEVSNLKNKCSDYESLRKQIEELEDEINNF